MGRLVPEPPHRGQPKETYRRAPAEENDWSFRVMLKVGFIIALFAWLAVAWFNSTRHKDPLHQVTVPAAAAELEDAR